MRVAILAIAILLTGCGGGGGPGNPLARSSNTYPVPYYTPVEVSRITPLYNSTDSQWAIADLSTANLTASGENLVVTGFESQPTTAATWNNFQIHVFGWQNNQLVDQTSSWFSNNQNVIVGTNSVKFADLDNNGQTDMVVAPYTDGAITSMRPAYVFFNSNNRFSRTIVNIDINSLELARANSRNYIDAHDFTIADLNNDGYKDIIIGDYGWNTTLAFNNGNQTFTTHTQKYRSMPGSSSLAAADFLNNGTVTILAVDQGHTSNKPGLYSWRFDGADLLFTELSQGPTPRFELSKWDSYNFGGGTAGQRSHNIRVVANDWNGDGAMDAVILSRPSNTDGEWPKYSEIQFLKNNGSGTFTDETDNVLVGYNTASVVSYNPKFTDINGDGLVDILLPTAGDFSGANNSSQILLKTSDGKFMAAYQNVLTDFSAQANTVAGVSNVGNTLNIIKSPDNKTYLVTAVKLSNQQMAVYLSLVGDNFVSATQAISTIQAQWPWMSDASANTLLSQTSKTYLNGQVIDLDAALAPIGSLNVNNQPLTGYLAGIRLQDSHLLVQDSTKRDFSVDVAPMQINTFSMWSRNTVPDQLQLSSQSEYLVGRGTTIDGFRIVGDSSIWSLGTPKFPISDRWNVNAQITQSVFNPWIQFGGMWGSVQSATMFETVFTYRDNLFQSQAGWITIDTKILPGLINKVDTINAVWAEAGYTDNKFGLYGGVRPYIVSGSVHANLPTGVDFQGNLYYTKTRMDLINPINGYVRAVYTDQFTKTTSYKFSGMLIDNGQYRIQTELRYDY
jgi:hypothetical protein